MSIKTILLPSTPDSSFGLFSTSPSNLVQLVITKSSNLGAMALLLYIQYVSSACVNRKSVLKFSLRYNKLFDFSLVSTLLNLFFQKDIYVMRCNMLKIVATRYSKNCFICIFYLPVHLLILFCLQI